MTLKKENKTKQKGKPNQKQKKSETRKLKVSFFTQIIFDIITTTRYSKIIIPLPYSFLLLLLCK